MTAPHSKEQKAIGRWTGITVHYDRVPAGNCAPPGTRLCEAVARAFHETMVLPVEHIRCLGARRSLGLADSDDELALRIATEAHIALDVASKAVEEVPRLFRPAVALTLGRRRACDVVIGYPRPATVMNLVRTWQETYGAGPTVKLSSFMALCGNVFAGACTSRQLCLSFGCPDSRKYGGIEEDMLVVGMSSCLSSLLFREKRQNANV